MAITGKRREARLHGKAARGPRTSPAKVPQKGIGRHTGRDRGLNFFLAATCAGRALTFNEPDRARPELACRILRIILLEGLHKKIGSSTLSGAQVAREASKGGALKLVGGIGRQAGTFGKSLGAQKFRDWPAQPKA